jgi:hypothetical protein
VSRAEAEFSKGKARDAVHEQLDTVRASATAWSAVTTVVLGIFGTVAFAGGLPTLDKVEKSWQTPLKWVTVIVLMLFLASTIMAAYAANGWTFTTNNTAWKAVRDSTTGDAQTARTWLTRSLIAGGAAAFIVIVGSCLLLFKGEATAAPAPPTVVAVIDGTAVCGPLTTASGRLTVGTQPLTEVDSLVIVEACPP